MKVTSVFSKNLKAYNDGYSMIANKGSTRSSKTFSELQLFYTIAQYSKKKRIISVTSRDFPHLERGAIRDFETILEGEGVNISSIRSKKPRHYTINNTLIEFIGMDDPGKALGSPRDILLLNEANKMAWSVCDQLMIRTRQAVFLDWNPAYEFWFEAHGLDREPTTKIINSTFFDNIQNLTPMQLNRFKMARRKAEEEEKNGVKGYWWNWWRVYGLGLTGMLEGVVFRNWKVFSDLPDKDFYQMFVVDWGGNDPTTLTELLINKGDMEVYIYEHIYQPQILNSKLIGKILDVNKYNNLLVYDSARKDKGYELKMAGIAAYPSKKYPGVKIDNIELLQEFTIFIHESATNAQNEFKKYSWAKDEKTGTILNKPEDGNDHIIDPLGYGLEFWNRVIKSN